jgi:hypothetical protein
MLLQTLHQIASSFGPLESFDLHQPEPTVDSPGKLQAFDIAHLPEFDHRRVSNVPVSSQYG